MPPFSSSEAARPATVPLSRRRPLRIAHVILDLEAGGAQMVCARLVNGLDRELFDARVIVLQGHGILVSRLRDRGIPVDCLEAPEGLRPEVVTRLAATLRANRVDLLHCHNCKAMLYGGLAALLAPGVKVVMTKHGLTHWETGAVAKLGRFLMRRAGAITAVSDPIAVQLTEGGWALPERLTLVRNGVDTEEFRPTEDRDRVRASLGFGPEHRLVGMVQRLSPEKDPANLLQAFTVVAKPMPEARLLVVGDGPLQPDLVRMAAEAGTTDQVSFLGARSDIAELLGALDVFCLPSRTEGTSLSLLEAMSAGVPVVATAVGGTPAVLEGEKAGLLVPPADPQRLAEALLKVLGSPEARREMGAEGRRIACERYSLSTSVVAYAGLYERLCSAAA